MFLDNVASKFLESSNPRRAATTAKQSKQKKTQARSGNRNSGRHGTQRYGQNTKERHHAGKAHTNKHDGKGYYHLFDKSNNDFASSNERPQ